MNVDAGSKKSGSLIGYTSSEPAYYPGLFDVANVDDAKRIILTPETDRTTEERWRRETPYLIDLAHSHLQLTASSIVIDYGCGIGRLAKELISRYGCRVVGVDISKKMRELAERYVDSDRFLACRPEGLDLFGAAFADAALAVWVLQHCPQPTDDIHRIKQSLKPGARLFVVNEKGRAIPTKAGWMSDSLDLRQTLSEQCELADLGRLDETIVTPAVSDRTFWSLYKIAPSNQAVSPTTSSTNGAFGSNIPSTASDPASAFSSDSAHGSSASPAQKGAYPAPAEAFTQEGPLGLRFDFNDGCRVSLPEAEHPWRVRLSDLDTGNILFETEINSGRVNSTKRYYVRIRLEVWQRGESVFAHDYCAADRHVLI